MQDNETGAILSFVGGRDFEEESFNLATQARRSVGSTVKPLMPFASAMERGIVQPGVVVPDVPTNYRGGGTFSNFGGGYAASHPCEIRLQTLETPLLYERYGSCLKKKRTMNFYNSDTDHKKIIFCNPMHSGPLPQR